jgi:hypothetical protein
MKELSAYIKRPDLRIMGFEEGEEVQAKWIHTSRTPNRLDQNRTSPQNIITKTSSTETKKEY